jgi:DNA primase
MKQQQIISLLKDIGVYSRAGAGGNLIVQCPFAQYSELHHFNKDQKPSMGILVKDAEPCLINCFTCGYKNVSLAKMLSDLYQYDMDNTKVNDAIDIAVQIELPNVDEVLALVDQISTSYSKHNNKFVLSKYEEDTPMDTQLWDPMKRRYHKYFEQRGISLDTCKVFESGYDATKKRVCLPIYDRNNILRGVVGRTIIDENPKYLNYFEFNKGKYLMGEHLIKRNNILIITEGMFDLLKGYQYLNDANLLDTYSIVALMGARLTDIQAITIIKLASQVVLFLDSDDVGIENSKLASSILGRSIITSSVDWKIIPKKDLGELTIDEFKMMLEYTHFV